MVFGSFPFTATSLLVAVTVFPWLKGAGWLTSGVEVTRMLRPPCTMLTAPMRTSEPRMTVPVRSLTTTLALGCS